MNQSLINVKAAFALTDKTVRDRLRARLTNEELLYLILSIKLYASDELQFHSADTILKLFRVKTPLMEIANLPVQTPIQGYIEKVKDILFTPYSTSEDDPRIPYYVFVAAIYDLEV